MYVSEARVVEWVTIYWNEEKKKRRICVFRLLFFFFCSTFARSLHVRLVYFKCVAEAISPFCASLLFRRCRVVFSCRFVVFVGKMYFWQLDEVPCISNSWRFFALFFLLFRFVVVVASFPLFMFICWAGYVMWPPVSHVCVHRRWKYSISALCPCVSECVENVRKSSSRSSRSKLCIPLNWNFDSMNHPFISVRSPHSDCISVSGIVMPLFRIECLNHDVPNATNTQSLTASFSTLCSYVFESGVT